VLHLDGGVLSERREQLCVESPLQILVKLGPDAEPQPLTITMRTPAASKLQRDEDDADLSLGFLLGEGIVRSPQQVLAVDSPLGEDRVVVTLRDDVQLPQRQLARSFVSTSACGVCGKSTLDGLAAEPSEPLRPGWPLLSIQALPRLPEQLLAAQATFAHTGGLHAAALFDSELRLVGAAGRCWPSQRRRQADGLAAARWGRCRCMDTSCWCPGGQASSWFKKRGWRRWRCLSRSGPRRAWRCRWRGRRE
jgi:FdhD protein